PPSPVFTMALTGGIATGKSSFAEVFRKLAPEETAFFDCDACVHELLTKPEVARMIAVSLGEDLADSEGRLDKSRLRERVFHDQESRRTLEGILHPLVRGECQLARQLALAAPDIRFFLMDVPLLYESGFPMPRDLEITVACGPATQRQRLMARSHFAPDLADRIIASQLPLMEKAARADAVIWNGGPRGALLRQTTFFFTWLKSKLNH
ncbi:MAG: dephospho-CoA kinase, partial [Verrucomicrobiaceae bacterium]